MEELFPRTTVAGISLPRMLIGTNWMAGWSHRSPAEDCMIKERHAESSSIVPMLEAFVNNGIDAIMGSFSLTPVITKAVREAEEKLGKKIIIIDTPAINTEDSAAGRSHDKAEQRTWRRLLPDSPLRRGTAGEQREKKH